MRFGSRAGAPDGPWGRRHASGVPRLHLWGGSDHDIDTSAITSAPSASSDSANNNENLAMIYSQ